MERLPICSIAGKSSTLASRLACDLFPRVWDVRVIPGALVSRRGARERGHEASGGRGVGHAHSLLFQARHATAAASSAALMAAITASSVGAPVRCAATDRRK